MYAIIATGGKQYKVAPGDVLEIEKLDVEEGAEVELPVIFVADGDKIEADPEKAAATKVTAKVLAQFKGKKILVKGNHDDLSDYRYKQLFHEICDYKEVNENFGGKGYKVVLSHYPILMWNGQHHGTILLYGHTHTSVEDQFFQECIRKMNAGGEFALRRRGDSCIRAINVGCMHPYMDYEPRSLKELLDAHPIPEGDETK